jgi:hypothetical protein
LDRVKAEKAMRGPGRKDLDVDGQVQRPPLTRALDKDNIYLTNWLFAGLATGVVAGVTVETATGVMVGLTCGATAGAAVAVT